MDATKIIDNNSNNNIVCNRIICVGITRNAISNNHKCLRASGWESEASGSSVLQGVYGMSPSPTWRVESTLDKCECNICFPSVHIYFLFIYMTCESNEICWKRREWMVIGTPQTWCMRIHSYIFAGFETAKWEIDWKSYKKHCCFIGTVLLLNGEGVAKWEITQLEIVFIKINNIVIYVKF